MATALIFPRGDGGPASPQQRRLRVHHIYSGVTAALALFLAAGEGPIGCGATAVSVDGVRA